VYVTRSHNTHFKRARTQTFCQYKEWFRVILYKAHHRIPTTKITNTGYQLYKNYYAQQQQFIHNIQKLSQNILTTVKCCFQLIKEMNLHYGSNF